MTKYIEKESVAVVGEETPLLVELSANENISLILKCHYRFSIKKAEKESKKLLQKCGYEEINDKKPFKLTKKEKLIVQYIRAYVSKFDKIAVIKPFSLIESIGDIEELYKLSKIFEDKEMEILDTLKHDFYEEKRCHIIK